MTFDAAAPFDQSEPITATRFTDPAAFEMGDGGFGVLRTRHGNLPLTLLDYHSDVVGLACQTVIGQTFVNPYDEPIEATYVFPMVAERAVTACQMFVDGRVIEAELRERGRARREYADAIARGHRAALLEENRSETFSIKVGNIPPGESVHVRLTTVGILPVAHGQWTLRLPLVVAPRYTAGVPLPGPSVESGTAADTDQVPDASAVTPPTLPADFHRCRLPGFDDPVQLRVSVRLRGIENRRPDGHDLQSSLHAVLVRPINNQSGNNRSGDHQTGDHQTGDIVVSSRPGERINRDFILRGSYAGDDVDVQAWAEPATAMVQLIPPPITHAAPRDIVFVLDRSGSMSGWKMSAATRAVACLIDALQPTDRFNVIAFDHTMQSFEDADEGVINRLTGRRRRAMGLKSGDAETRRDAARWVRSIRARGGTEMGPPLARAAQCLADHGLADDGLDHDNSNGEPSRRSAAIVLITDGQITGEDAMLRVINDMPDAVRPRLFALGIDTAVNASVLKRLADQTGGMFELAENETRLNEVLDRFADDMGRPSLLDISLSCNGCEVTDELSCPSPMAYAGRAKTYYIRTDKNDPFPSIELNATDPAGRRWTRTVKPQSFDAASLVSPGASSRHSPGASSPFLGALWGRSSIRHLEDQFAAGGGEADDIRDRIVETSLCTGVLSRFTAFVAVDRTEVIGEGNPRRIRQSVESPEGWLWPTIPPSMRMSTHAPPVMPPKILPRRDRASIDPTASLGLKKFQQTLLRQNIVSPEQWDDAMAYSQSRGHRIEDALIEMGYANETDVVQCMADCYGIARVNLRTMHIPEAVIELIPETVARENMTIPIEFDGGQLVVAVSDPTDLEILEKLRFILNQNVRPRLATASEINEAINRYYGQVEGESAVSMLQEFTDVAIDFTETAEETDRLDFDEAVDIDPMDALSASDGSADVDPVAGASFGFAAPPPLARVSRAKMRKRSGGDDVPNLVSRLFQLCIAEAVQTGSDRVRIEQTDGEIRVQFRTEGRWIPRDSIAANRWRALLAHIRKLSGLPIGRNSGIQTGVLTVTIGNVTHQLKVTITDDRECEIQMENDAV